MGRYMRTMCQANYIDDLDSESNSECNDNMGNQSEDEVDDSNCAVPEKVLDCELYRKLLAQLRKKSVVTIRDERRGDLYAWLSPFEFNVLSNSVGEGLLKERIEGVTVPPAASSDRPPSLEIGSVCSI